MSKIVIDARESGTSTGRYIDKLLENLHKFKTNHKFVVLTKPKRVEFIKKIAPNFEVVESPYKEFTLAEQTKLFRQIKKLGPDLVHFGMVQQPVFYGGKTVTTMNDLTTTRFRNPTKNWLIFMFKQQVYKLINWRVAHKASAIITYTEWVKDDIAKNTATNSRKFTPIHLSADKIIDPAEPVEGLKDAKYIMYVGRPQPHKNLERLISAYNLLKKDNPELKMVFAGKKDILFRKLELKAKIKSKDIVFTGFVSEGQLRWLYEHAEAYVFPSLSEGFGLPGLEAMVHGCPVVSSNATCLPEVYGDAAEYFDPLNVEEMAEAISNVINNPKRRNELITKGKKQAGKYSWRRTAEQTLEVYNTVLGTDSK